MLHGPVVELDAAAAVAGESLSVSQRNQLSQRTNAWAYFDTLVSSNVGLGESAPVLRAMARSHCASEGEVKALAARVAGSSASVPSAHAVLHTTAGRRRVKRAPQVQAQQR